MGSPSPLQLVGYQSMRERGRINDRDLWMANEHDTNSFPKNDLGEKGQLYSRARVGIGWDSGWGITAFALGVMPLSESSKDRS